MIIFHPAELLRFPEGVLKFSVKWPVGTFLQSIKSKGNNLIAVWELFRLESIINKNYRQLGLSDIGLALNE
jgi:hypothetical protein